MDKTLTSPNPPSRAAGAILLETSRLIVRRFVPTDAEALAAAANHAGVSKNMSDRFPSPYTVERAAKTIAEANESASINSPPRRAAVFIKPQTKENPGPVPLLVGSVAVRAGEDILYRTWSIGYFVTPAAWGKGYASELVSTFARWLLTTWPDLRRVEGESYSTNPASIRVLQKSGFVQEGVRRQAATKSGEAVDLVVFGMIRTDVGLE